MHSNESASQSKLSPLLSTYKLIQKLCNKSTQFQTSRFLGSLVINSSKTSSSAVAAATLVVTSFFFFFFKITTFVFFLPMIVSMYSCIEKGGHQGNQNHSNFKVDMYAYVFIYMCVHVPCKNIMVSANEGTVILCNPISFPFHYFTFEQVEVLQYSTENCVNCNFSPFTLQGGKLLVEHHTMIYKAGSGP